MDLCETCVKKVICNQCEKRLCYADPDRDELAKKPHCIEGHYYRDDEILCMKCYEKNHSDKLFS